MNIQANACNVSALCEPSEKKAPSVVGRKPRSPIYGIATVIAE
nr:MAG TPA: hypothetical protein [Caudoviricetes sp.]